MKQIGKHVCVDYSSGSFGDWLRYLMSLHDGFEKFTEYAWKSTLEYQEKLMVSHFRKEDYQIPSFPLHPDKKIDFVKANTIDKFYSEFDRLMPKNKEYRQAYKPFISKKNKNAGMSHSFVGATWLEENAIIDGVPFKWDYHDYNIVRQTDHKIVFITLNPFSKYKDVYLYRHEVWDDYYGRNYNTQKHLECWTRNYMKNDFPKHKLNYTLEINELLDGHENVYLDLVKFIDVKPLDNWRDYIDEFQRHIFQK